MMSNLSMDEKSRVSIVEDIDTNIFVEAGAGSGKTTMLVNRMVAMIEAGKQVEKICAITFTKNAALEFYERFQAKLIERSNPSNHNKPKHAGDLPEPNDLSRSRCAKALENIDLCFMGTIDSFCNMILSEHPTEAMIPSDARLINDNEAKQIYKQFYIDIRRGKYGDNLKLLSDRFNMFFWGAEDNFAILIKEIMDRRNVNFHYDDDLCIDFYKCFSKQRNDIKKVLNKFKVDTSKIVLPLKDETLDPIEVFNNYNETIQRDWKYNYKGVEIALNGIKDLSYEATCEELGFTNESVIRQQDNKIILNIKDKDNVDALIYKLQNYKYQNTLKFLLECIKPLEELMRKQGKFTYFDYLYYLRNMLVTDSKKDGKLISYIYDRHSYFLIDEFQDTNPMQAEIFFYLAAKDPRQTSWKNCEPKDGSLFIVGDPKQSIYRFRSADVSSYLNIKKLFEGYKNCKVKYLVNNFRSKNVIKQYFNDVFEEVMDIDTLDQSKYQDIENCDSSELDEFKGIYKYTSYTDSLNEIYPEMEDSLRVAEVINSIIKSDKKIIDNGILRKIKYSDFMLITYSKKKIDKFIKTFKSLNIPIRVEGKVLFNQSQALKTITSIYKTISSNDQIALIETLKGPIFGFNDNDLNEYKKEGNIFKLDFNKDYKDTGIDSALKKLIETSKKIDNQTPSSLFELIIDEYEIFKYLSSDSLEIIYYALELIRNEELSGNIVTYEDTINYLNDLINDNSDIERSLSLKQDIDAVHIANLHKVKGLEAPIVILVKQGISKKAPSIRIEYSDDLKTNETIADGHIFAFKEPDETLYNIIETSAYKDYADKEVESLKKEVDRLIYVAATRARNVLIVNETMQKKGDKFSSAGKRNQWYYLLEKVKDDIFKVVKEDNAFISSVGKHVNASVLYDIESLKQDDISTYQYKKPSEIKYSSKIDDSLIDEETNNDATLLGTMVHRLLEMIIMSKDKLNKDDMINNNLNEYVTPEYIDNKNDYKQILSNVYDKIHNGGYPQVNGIKQDILPLLLSKDVKTYCEIPFTYKDDSNTIWKGIIDLVYEKDNELHIIDWKTNKENIGLDEEYKSQLEAYTKAIKNILNKDVKDAYIYHIDIN